MRAALLTTLVLVLAEATFELTDAPRELDEWTHVPAMWLCAGLLLARAASHRPERTAWLLLGIGMAFYAVGDTLWQLVYANQEPAPFPSWSDAFWSLWNPLAFAGLVLLVRHRVKHFSLHRWLDGIAAGLIVAIPSVALVLDPVLDEERPSFFASFVDVSYPIGDIVLLGAIIGAISLTGWHPGLSWTMLAIGCAILTVVDSVYAVQTLEDSYKIGEYDFVWPLGSLAIASAAWVSPRAHAETHWGWRAIALAVGCQVVAIATQIYGIWFELPHMERILTAGVLAVAVVQIVITRPRQGVSTAGS